MLFATKQVSKIISWVHFFELYWWIIHTVYHRGKGSRVNVVVSIKEILLYCLEVMNSIHPEYTPLPVQSNIIYCFWFAYVWFRNICWPNRMKMLSERGLYLCLTKSKEDKLLSAFFHKRILKIISLIYISKRNLKYL